jgi:hypothetical protein
MWLYSIMFAGRLMLVFQASAESGRQVHGHGTSTATTTTPKTYREIAPAAKRATLRATLIKPIKLNNQAKLPQLGLLKNKYRRA